MSMKVTTLRVKAENFKKINLMMMMTKNQMNLTKMKMMTSKWMTMMKRMKRNQFLNRLKRDPNHQLWRYLIKMMTLLLNQEKSLIYLNRIKQQIFIHHKTNKISKILKIIDFKSIYQSYFTTKFLSILYIFFSFTFQ